MADLELLKKKLEREKLARKQAESILESKALELYQVNESLKELNNSLEHQIQNRTIELKKSEERYRSLVELASDIIFNVDKNGFFTFINAIGASQFGFSQEDIVGKQYIEFVRQDYKEELFKYYLELKENKTLSDYKEFPVVSKEGEISWVGQNVNRIEEKDGHFYYSAVARDITKRKNTEQALELAKQEIEKSEVKYRSIMENMELGLMEVDTNGTIIRVYDRFKEMTGYEDHELIGKNAIEALVVKGFEEVIKKQDNNRLSGETGIYEMKIRKKDNTEIWVLISGAPFFDGDGNIKGSIGIHYDITERKNLESDLEIARQEAVNAQLAEKQFLANMSHEIRTPLNAIIGMSHLLADTDLGSDQIEYLNVLTSSTSLLKNLISDILDISKIDAGSIEIQNSYFSIKEMADLLTKTISVKSTEKPIEFISRVDTKIDREIFSDRQLINQILLNLLSNAEKFTSEGEIELAIELVSQNGISGRLKFTVRDTGIGMDEEELAKIFEQFTQANSSIRQSYGGTGLGLTISKKLVEILGGELTVESIKGEGSLFSFELDFGFGSKNRSALQRQSITGINRISGLHKHVLIVEDNKMNQQYITALLKKWSLKYTVAENGQEAVDLFRTEKYDIIFMDLSMPVMDGYEASTIIRTLENGHSNIPIIALTASTFLSKKQLALKAGMTDFISKPFTPDQLNLILEKYLKVEEPIVYSLEKFEYHNALDQINLRRTYGEDLHHALMMFETFLEIIDDEMLVLDSKIKEKDKKLIKNQIHKIKPTFSMVGLTKLTEDFEILESKAFEMDVADIQIEVEEKKKEIKTFVPILESEIAKLSLLTKSEI